MPGETLEEDADYGRLPFDIFLSERWDHTTTRDDQQWERLVWEWESLTLLARFPCQQRAQSESAPPELSEEIKRVLATHQTVYERDISLVSCDGCHTVWLRTCYDPDLAEKYEQMKWESKWAERRGDRAQLQEGNERYRDLSLANLKVQAGLYLLDREAIESGLIKILWLDEHAQISWEHRLNPYTSTLSQVTGCLMDATSLVELAGYNGAYGAQISTD